MLEEGICNRNDGILENIEIPNLPNTNNLFRYNLNETWTGFQNDGNQRQAGLGMACHQPPLGNDCIINENQNQNQQNLNQNQTFYKYNFGFFPALSQDF